jgi:hypothetical protein
VNRVGSFLRWSRDRVLRFDVGLHQGGRTPVSVSADERLRMQARAERERGSAKPQATSQPGIKET